MAIQFSEEQVRNRINFENPWWNSGEIDAFYNRMERRAYFSLLFPLIEERSIKRAVVLMGPRRVGKTVLLYHSIHQLIQNGVSPDHIAYFSVETPIYNGIGLEELVNLYLGMKEKTPSEETFIFFDEIQYLKDWERHLKSLVDSYHNIKFIVSGSAAAALKLKSQESGAGRFTEFTLPPLTFYEFLQLTGQKELIQGEIADPPFEFQDYVVRDYDLLNAQFIDYINFGGYPELSLSKTAQSDPGRYIRNDIIDKVLLRDLPSLYGINDIQELNSLFTYLAYNTGNEVSLDGISKNSGVAKNTIRKYLTYLEAAFLIMIIHRVDQNGKRFKRANFFKVYLTNPSLRSALFSPITSEDEHIGNMVETAIFSQWHHDPNPEMYYARWPKGEVDLVHLQSGQIPKFCIEIKWTNRFVNRPSELGNLEKFARKSKIKDVGVTTIDQYRSLIHENINYEFIPASLYCYILGRNLIKRKQKKL